MAGGGAHTPTPTHSPTQTTLVYVASCPVPAHLHSHHTNYKHSLSSAYDAGRAFADSLQHTYHTHTFTAALQAALAAAPGGLDVSHHTFRTSRAVAAHDSFGSSPPAVRECVNVHAVLHSPRGDGKEALVLVTPVNHQHFVTGRWVDE